jgi:hypothetical protein
MTDALRVIALGLICWRVTSLLVREDGPLDIFAKLRKIIGVSYNEYSVPAGSNAIARGLLCVWCTSVWVATPLAIFAPLPKDIQVFWLVLEGIGYVLLISAIAILVDSVIERGQERHG